MYIDVSFYRVIVLFALSKPEELQYHKKINKDHENITDIRTGNYHNWQSVVCGMKWSEKVF